MTYHRLPNSFAERRWRSDPDKIDVNVRCFDHIDIADLKLSSFDGKNWEKAIEGNLSWR